MLFLKDCSIIASSILFCCSESNPAAPANIALWAVCIAVTSVSELTSFDLDTCSLSACFCTSHNSLPDMTKGAISIISLNFALRVLSFSFKVLTKSLKRASSSMLIALPSLINFSCKESFSALSIVIWLSMDIADASFSEISPSIIFISLVSFSNLFWLIILPAFFLNLILRFSRFLLISSYFLIPRTSLYAELNLRFSSSDFTSARFTIFSASKRKKVAIFLERIKSLMNIS